MPPGRAVVRRSAVASSMPPSRFIHGRECGCANGIGKDEGTTPLEIEMHHDAGEHGAIVLPPLRPHQPGAVSERFAADPLYGAICHEQIAGAHFAQVVDPVAYI